MLDSDASTAKTLTLVAIVLQLVSFVLVVLAAVFFAVVFSIGRITTTYGNVTKVVSSTPYFPIAFFSAILAVFFLIGLFWILLDYFLIYNKLAKEQVKEAETPSLVLGVVQLIFGGVITGILLIVAYVKIRDSLEKSAR